MAILNRADMLYDDGFYYKWTAGDDKDNPYYRGGSDRAQLNRTEGYEVRYFINHIASKWPWTNSVTKKREEASLHTLRKLEKMIRYDVPGEIRKRDSIEKWLSDNWSKY